MHFCNVNLSSYSPINIKTMSFLKNAIEALDPAPDKQKELTLLLNLLFELAEQKEIARLPSWSNNLEPPELQKTHRYLSQTRLPGIQKPELM
jgi:hypothetical protein